MPDLLKLDLRIGGVLEGSRPYVIYVDVTNVSPSSLLDVEVDPEVYPGILTGVAQTSSESQPDELQSARVALIREMERQVRSAWNVARMRKLGAFDQIVFMYMRLLTMDIAANPMWATEALKIRDKEDIARLEKEIISELPETSRIRKCFLIDREKLERILDSIEERDRNKNEDVSRPLSPMAQGETRTFTFRGTAPFLWTTSDLTFRFSARFRTPDSTTVSISSVDRPFACLCSPSAVPVGTLAGAAAGYLVRGCLLTQADWTASRTWGAVVGSLVLALIVAALIRNTPDSRRSVRVENFLGGFVIGALVGLFSEQFLAFAARVVGGVAGNTTLKP